jgi:tetratricopeptide (TPR) repeat protein
MPNAVLLRCFRDFGLLRFAAPFHNFSRQHAKTSVHFSSRSGRRRRKLPGVALAARGGNWLLLSFLAVTLSTTALGCATFGRRGAAQEKIAAGRELSRQGVAAMEVGNWQQAEALLQQAVEASPEEADTHRHLAEALWHRGAADAAMKHMGQALRLEPNDATLLVRAGEMSLAMADHNTALSRAERAIQLDAKLADGWALRGRVFGRLGQSDRAMADLQRALEISPQDPEALLDVALMYRQRGEAARALTTLHYLLDTYAPGEEPQLALQLEGLTLMELGRAQQASESFQLAARRGPPNADVLYHLAQAQSRAGRYAEANAAARQALAIDASHQASRQLLIQLAANNPPIDLQRR